MKSTLLFLLVTLVAAPFSLHAELISGIAAVVNDEVITTYDVSRNLETLTKEAEKRAPLSQDDKNRLRETALNQLVDRKLVEQKIRELNIKVPEEEVRQAIEDVKKQNKLNQETLTAALRSQGMTFDQYKEQFREQMERIRLMSQEVRSKVQVGEKEVAAFYEANPGRFREDDRYHARHIFFSVKKGATPEEIERVKEKGKKVLQEARSGKDFISLAKQYSDDPGAKEDGGDLGTFRKGEMLPEFEKTVLAMKEGEVSDLVTTPAGIHIIKLDQKIPGRLKPLQEARGEIEELLFKEKSEERFAKWLEELKKSASIEIKK